MSILTEKPINEILNYNFFIPAYQRGYRWTEQQVEDLLADIDNFIPRQVENTDKKTWYCLQPIVVKKCGEETKRKNNLDGIWYEVIDGQQRLTTIFLIICYTNKEWGCKQKNFEWQIKYETRNDSYAFLQNFKKDISSSQISINEDNIDYFYISKAYDTINNKLKDYNEENQNDFQSKFKSNSKVIWYEVLSDKDSVEIFTRINMGKIPLTSAELIKALFLNSSNFNDSDPAKIRLKQLEIASEWDRIEYVLQNEEFWYFINNTESSLPTRIECIFNLMECIEGKKNGNDQYATFRFFSGKFKSNSEKEIESNWEEIKTLYQTLEEWFTNRELYHKTGYLIATGADIKDLIVASRNKQKVEFKKYLNEKINEKIKCEDVSDLEYGNPLIKKILLFHNIQTMLSNENESSRFPFDRYKKGHWDIEHIHAIATEMPTDKQHKIDWLNNSQEFIDCEDLKIEISSYIQNYDEKNKADTDSFDKISKKVLDHYSKKSNEGKPHEDINDISNLALLDSGTNRSYKNAVFPVKRRTIIEKEKNGTFIPICTKNAFLKYYSNNVSQLTFWDTDDRKAYLDNINALLFPSLSRKEDVHE